MKGLVSITTKETLLYSILHPLIGDIPNCLCKNIVVEFLFEALLSSLHLSYSRCEDDLIEELLCGVLSCSNFFSDIALYRKMDQKMLRNYWP
jgi:hypothetical protein